MRISVTQLRSVILVVNLVLAGSLVYKALAAYDVIDLVFGGDVGVESHPARVDLENFVYREGDLPGSRRDPASDVMRVSSDLQPPKPQLVSNEPPKPVEPKETEDEPVGEQELPEGPLAKDWEYVYYIAWQGESGVRNFAQIRKKEEEKAARTSYSRSNSRSRTITSSRARTRSAATRGRTSSKYSKKSDSVSFLVSDRRIQNEEFDLDFWVHSADSQKLVYWLPGRPAKRYALPYKHEGNYLQQGPMRKELRPEEDEDEEEEEEKKSFYVIHEDANPEEARERQYEEISAGKSSESRFAPSKGKTSRASSERSDASNERPSGSRLRPSTRGSESSKPTKEDIKELKDALDKIPEKEQEKVKEELQEMLQGNSN